MEKALPPSRNPMLAREKEVMVIVQRGPVPFMRHVSIFLATLAEIQLPPAIDSHPLRF